MRINLFLLLLFIITSTSAYAEKEPFFACPVCSDTGEVICPPDSQAGCNDEAVEQTIPKCVFLGEKYVVGCWKYTGVKKLDIDFAKLNLPPSVMINVIGGGETYTLNRETIGCRKL